MLRKGPARKGREMHQVTDYTDPAVAAELDYLRGEVARLRQLLAACAAGMVAGAGDPETDAELVAATLERSLPREISRGGGGATYGLTVA